MRLDLRPLAGVGPIRINSPMSEAEAALAGLEGYVEPEPHRRRPGYASLRSGLSMALAADRDGSVVSIEVYRSDDDAVEYDGVDVFRTPADEVIRRLQSVTELRIEEDGRTVIATALSMSMWRPTVPESDDDDEGRYFQSVLVAREGYFALPGQ